MFFNEKGILKLDEMVANQPSFKKIMEDGIITEQELSDQSDKVVALLHQLEKELTPTQQEIVKDLLIEVNVMNAVFHQFQLQNIH